MQISRTLGGCTNDINGKYFPTNSVILRIDNGIILVCQDFRKTRNGSTQLFCYLPKEKKWVITYAKNEYTEIMLQYYRDTIRKANRKKQRRSKTNYSQMMRHDRKKKSGGGGCRISHTETVTDYECSSHPLHDFQRTFY